MAKGFDWLEYTVFLTMPVISFLIGLYFGCYKGAQKTVSEYFLGDKKMSLFPIAMSLISSQVSGVTLLGVPTEIYTYGTQYALSVLTCIVITLITYFIYLPVFYELQVISVYEYLELRFNHGVRMLASLLYIISTVLFIPVIIYGPAIALNQVSGLNINVITPVICIICIIYTMLGGFKAVVWTDTIQGVTMILSLTAIVIMGVIKADGVSTIFKKAAEGSRLELFNMDPDPTARMSFWTVSIGLTFTWVAYVSINPGMVQRFMSLPTFAEAKLSLFLLLIGILMFAIPSMFLGLIMYAVYNECDPISAKIIDRPDQILPYFLLDLAEHTRGLPGLFIAGIFCAALSTMSTGLNTVAGTIYEDFIRPYFNLSTSDSRASFIMKILVAVVGTVCLGMVFVIDKMGAILEISSKFGGLTSGSCLGIFTLGLLFPSANSKGALVGGLVSLFAMSWVMVGFQVANYKGLIAYQSKPMSTDGCSSNFTSILINVTNQPDESVWPLYKLSMFYYGMMGCLIVLTVGMAVTYLTGPLKPELINPDLLAPLVRKKIQKPHYKNVSRVKP